jgi:hypothetical protein
MSNLAPGEAFTCDIDYVMQEDDVTVANGIRRTFQAECATPFVDSPSATQSVQTFAGGEASSEASSSTSAGAASFAEASSAGGYAFTGVVVTS